jgi:GNAT superfamily N-acetyltransferase
VSARQPVAEMSRQFRIRSAVPSDRGQVERLLAAMDRAGLYQRHFAHGDAPNQALLKRMSLLDHRQRVAVLALAAEGDVIGQAEYVAEDGAAEFALMVLPQYRGQGIGKRMLQALIDIAMAAGLDRMHGMIQAANRGAIRVARECGFQAVPGDDRAVVIVSRTLPARGDTAPDRPAAETADYPPTANRPDPDRTPIHRRAGP